MSKETMEILKLVVLGVFLIGLVVYFLFLKDKKKKKAESDHSSIFTGKHLDIPEVDILISTTNWLPGYNIEEIKGMDYYVVAQGAGFFSDWLAKWSDFFGTKSRSYSEAFEEPILYGYRKLMERSVKMGGNALIGVKVSPVAVPGDKSMIIFMFEGTVVIARNIKTNLRPLLDQQAKTQKSATIGPIGESTGKDRNDTPTIPRQPSAVETR